MRFVSGLVAIAASAASLSAFAACGAFDDAVAPPLPLEDAGPAPIFVVSPSRDGGLTYPETITWTIAALPDDAIIRYTVDGTDPTPSSKSASGRVTLADLPDGTRVKWTTGAAPEVNELIVSVDGPNSRSARAPGVILQNFRFATTTAPITAVQRGVSSVKVSADIRLWNQADCPTCIDFLTVGIDQPSDCFAASVPGVYPGKSGLKHEFVLSVPETAGVYPIRIGFHQVYDCPAALKEPLSDTIVGMLVVTP